MTREWEMNCEKDKQIAIQIGAVSFVDEGIEPVLDSVQDLALVDTVFLANFTYTRGTGGRVLPGHDFPDHGARLHDVEFRGGAQTAPDEKYYRKTFIRPEDFTAREHNGWDMMREVVPMMHDRGMKAYSWIEESSGLTQNERIPNYFSVLEEDAFGRKGRRPCFNNPDYHNWHLGMVEDQIKSYGVDGIAWASERQGPLGNLMLQDGPWASESQPTCFCDHCQSIARARGINVERARQGYIDLKNFMLDARDGNRPRDGYFVTFWRLLIRYPEIFAWEALWHDSQKRFFKHLYGTAKAIDPNVQVGWHIFHLNSMSPFYRATQDISEMTTYSDFIKLVAYNVCAGPRFADYMHNLHMTILRDAKPEESLQLMHRFLGIEEGDLEYGLKHGWSADFVGRETRRAVEAVRESRFKSKILTGIDINVPISNEASLYADRTDLKAATPDDIYASTRASLEAGADGLVISRKYSEMELRNLRACGDAIRDFQKRGA
jgi:hypothetical protein